MEELKQEDVPLGDRANMAYKSTLVTAGKGTGVVAATGMKTEIGRIAQLMQEKEKTVAIYKLGIFSNRPMVGALALMASLQLAIIYIPVLNEFFATAPLTWQELLVCIVVSATPAHGVELEKIFRKKK